MSDTLKNDATEALEARQNACDAARRVGEDGFQEAADVIVDALLKLDRVVVRLERELAEKNTALALAGSELNDIRLDANGLRCALEQADAALRKDTPFGYAVVMDTGHFVGIWRDRDTAELVCAKQPPSHGDRVVPVYATPQAPCDPAPEYARPEKEMP